MQAESTARDECASDWRWLRAAECEECRADTQLSDSGWQSGRLKCALSHSIWEGDRNHNNHRAAQSSHVCLYGIYLPSNPTARNEAPKEPLRTKKGRTASLWNERRRNERHETPEKGRFEEEQRASHDDGAGFTLSSTYRDHHFKESPAFNDRRESERDKRERIGISWKFFHHVHGKCEPQIAIAAYGGPEQFSKLNFRCLHSLRFSSPAQREHF